MTFRHKPKPVPDTAEDKMAEAVGCLLGVVAIGFAGIVAIIKLVVEPWLNWLF